MKRFAITVDITAPTDRVWAVIFDGERWPEWTSTVTEVRRLDQGPIVPGSRVLIRQPKLPPAVWQVTELNDGHSFTWVTRSPGVMVIARHSVAPNATGSTATLSIEFAGLFGGIAAWLTRSLNEQYLKIEAAGLKQRSEQERSRSEKGEAR